MAADRNESAIVTAIQPSFQDFQRLYDAGTPQAVRARLVSDLDTPLGAMLKLTGGRAHAFLLESVTGGSVRGRYSVIGMQPDLIWRCQNGIAFINRQAETQPDAFMPTGLPPLQSLAALIEESRIDLPADIPPMAAGLFGYLGYDMVRLAETLPNANPDPIGIPDSLLIRPTLVAVFDGIEHTIALTAPVRPMPEVSAAQAYARAQAIVHEAIVALNGPLPPQQEAHGEAAMPTCEEETAPYSRDPSPYSNITRAAYHRMVERAKDYIAAGDIFQIVPSQRFSIPFHLPPLALYRALRRLNPSPFLFFLDFGTMAIVGSSPEILVRLRDDIVTIRPIAGTRKRGASKAEDATLAADLLSDPKEIAEHLMLLDLGRNDVGRVSLPGTVSVTEQFIVEYYSHVMHIVSNVEGKRNPNCGPIDVLMAGFPAGTVSGAPKVRAMEIIDELENVRRGLYGGCIGYFGADGAMDSCIALRTALIKDGTMHVQAGGGVVADSDPEAEYQETVNKAKALLRAAEEAGRFHRPASAQRD
jgi:anthranilate synthase component I